MSQLDAQRQRWGKYLFLAYLLLYFSPWLQEPPGPGALAASAAGVAVFLPLYLTGYGRPGWRGRPHAAGILAIGLLLQPAGGGWGVFVVYAMAMAGFARPQRLSAAALVAQALAVAAFGLARGLPPWEWAWSLFFGGIVGLSCLFLVTLEEKNRALSDAREEARRLAVTAERERIARDLHDVLGHTLTLVAVKADLARKLLDREPAAAQRELEEIHAAARAALADLRSAVSGMRATTLAAELAEARRALESAGIAVEASAAPAPLPPVVETALAYVVREATTNVVRHSGARRCHITLQREGPTACLEVTDDGRGQAIVEGHGVHGMRQRLAAVQGQLTLSTGGGTRVVATVPLGGGTAP